MKKPSIKVSERERETSEPEGALQSAPACTAIAEHTPEQYKLAQDRQPTDSDAEPLLPLED